MKRTTLIILAILWASILPVMASVGDALKDIWPVTDPQMTKSLNGTWSLKVVKGVNGEKTIPATDSTWGTIPVPGCWEQYGFSKARYSFPDSLTGYYRTSFQVPAAWKGQRVCIRLDGVLRGYDLWINGKCVGTWELPYNTCLFDITPYLTKQAFRGETQQLAMRVYSRYKGFEFDCFDDWAPMGIFRDVTLFAVPNTHLSNLTVNAKINGEVDVKTEVANPTRHTTVSYEILDAQNRIVSTGGKISCPQLWTAETPYLYTLRVYVKEKGETTQTFNQKIGLREMSIENGNILKLNGQPIKLRGVTCHATDPRTVKVISDTLTLKDMKMMKEASVNYIRTSHYPREPRFYELADSLGFYIICEVPFGSRGEKHLKDTTYFDNLKTRAKATINLHRNHPSVVVWSLGNENPLTKMTIKVGEYVKSELDSSHFICYPQKGSYFRTIRNKFSEVADIYAPHYPTTSMVKDFFQRNDRPVIFTEYLHSLGISFEDHDRQWEIIERTPSIAGGSVWEWVDQGMPFKKHRPDRYGYEECVYTSPDGGFEMNGNQGTDGLLYADRTPLPNYYELQHNYAQACVVDSSVAISSDKIHMIIRNRYDFINLKDNVTFFWSLTANRDTIARGAFSPECEPHTSIPYALPLPACAEDKILVLDIDVKNSRGWSLLQQAYHLRGAWKPQPSTNIEMPIQQGPLVRVGRKATMAELLKVKDSRIERYLQPLDNPYVKGEVAQEGTTARYTLTPDTAKRFLPEMGVAYLLSPEIDRVQWIGKGPFATYPGRKNANRYGFWAMQKDDLYFEGNRMDVDACWLSDKDGRGIVISGEHLNINFEQTDRGIVVTVNAAVAGQGPKFAKTAFGGWSDKIGTKTGSFHIQATEKGCPYPALMQEPATIPAAFHPYYTQYDTYLMRYNEIIDNNE